MVYILWVFIANSELLIRVSVTGYKLMMVFYYMYSQFTIYNWIDLIHVQLSLHYKLEINQHNNWDCMLRLYSMIFADDLHHVGYIVHAWRYNPTSN